MVKQFKKFHQVLQWLVGASWTDYLISSGYATLTNLPDLENQISNQSNVATFKKIIGNQSGPDFASVTSATNLLFAGGSQASPSGMWRYIIGSGVADDLVGRTATQTLTNKTLTSPTFATGVAADGSGFKHKRFGATCATAATAGATCTTTESWTTAFADANYTAICIGVTPTGTPSLGLSATQVAASVTIRITAITATASSYSAVDCVAVHD